MRTRTLPVCLLLFAVLTSGCASLREAAVADQLRSTTVAETEYQAPTPVIWATVQQLLHAQGYDPIGVPSLNGILRTHDRCRGSKCDALRVTVTPSGTCCHTITVVRRDYEMSDMIVPMTEPAHDIEWQLLQTLEPTKAQAIDAAAKDGARTLVASGSTDPLSNNPGW